MKQSLDKKNSVNSQNFGYILSENVVEKQKISFDSHKKQVDILRDMFLLQSYCIID